MAEFFPELMRTIHEVDWFTWTCALMMAAAGSSLVFTQVGSWILALIYFPGLVVGSTAGRVAARRLDIYLATDKQVDTIIVVGFSAILTLLALMLFSAIFMALSNWMTPPPTRKARDADALISRRI